MFRKFVKNVSRAVVMFVCLLFVANFFTGCSFGNKSASYSISGYVFDEGGSPVENVKIQSELGEVYTNEEGKYTITGIKESILLKPSIAGYHFAVQSKKIQKKTDNANFIASKEYVAFGTVDNNGLGVPNASVSISSLAGNFQTTTDENGRFEASGVAGEATLSCTVGNDKYYTATATIDNPRVRINSTSSFTMNFIFENEQVDYSKIGFKIKYKTENGNLKEDSVKIVKPSTTFKEVKYGMVVELESDYYRFSKNTIEINKLDQISEVNVYKVYSISGLVQSGTTPLSYADVYLDNEKVTKTDSRGNFTIDEVIKNRTISVAYKNFVFNTAEVSHENTTANFNGTKDITLSLGADFVLETDFNSASDFRKIDESTYVFTGVALGDQIYYTSNNYHFSEGMIVVGEDDNYSTSASALYDAEIDVDIEDITIILDGNEVSVSALSNLYGTHVISASFENYIFTEVEVGFLNKTAVLDYKVPYSAKLTIRSAELILRDSFAKVNGKTFEADNQGIILISGLVGRNNIEIGSEGFTSKTIEVNVASDLIINLSYSLSGVVKTGDTVVPMAEVSINGLSTTTDTNGRYYFAELYGAGEIIVSKPHYQFESAMASFGGEINFDGTYDIYGTLSAELGVLAGETVILRKVADSSEISAVTDAEGKFEFSGLSGKYFLYSLNRDLELKPDGYAVSAGGSYNFSMSGFKISGYIKTGGIPISGVYVIAGSESTYTDENGRYVFELLTSECEVSVQKTGYLFSSPITVSEDAENVNFTGSYAVSGKVTSAGFIIVGVDVYVNSELMTTTDENGEYAIAGLEGESEITFEKEGYVFESAVTTTVAGTFDVVCSAIKTVSVTTGSIPVSGVEIYINDRLYDTTETHEASIVANIGDVVSFKKTGYVISSVTITEEVSYTASASYSVTGTVVSGTRVLSNVLVSVGTTKITTDALGNFTVSGLVGEATLTFSKTDFATKTQKVSAYTNNFEINLTYSISGTVYVGNKTMAGAVVTCGAQTFTTLADGKFSFDGISGEYSLSCEKTGYTFDSLSGLFGTQKINLNAKYNLSGTIVSGTLPVQGVSVTLTVADDSNTIKTDLSDADGKFEFVGLSGTCSIKVECDGYETQEIAGFVDANTNIKFDLTYSYHIDFGTSGVTVYVNGKEYAKSGSFNTIEIKNLKGENTISLKKSNTAFTPNDFKIDAPNSAEDALKLSFSVAYAVSGTVTIKGTNIGASNVPVKIGTKETVTDTNGYYSFTDVAGNVYVSNSDLNSANDSYPVSSDGTYNLTVESYDYAYFLYENAYRNLSNNPTGFEIVGKGDVVPSMGGKQTVYAMSKKDANGDRIKQNLNYGSEILGVDPKVSLVAYYNNSQNQWSYHQTKSVSSNLTASHSKSNLQNISVDSYKATYGCAPDAYLPYNFTKNSGISSISTISLSASGEYKFQIALSTAESVWTNYAVQMNKLSSQDVASFSHINLNFTIDKDGWITQLYVDEKYQVELMSVKIDGDIYYNFTKENADIKLINLNNITDAVKPTSNSLLNFAKKYDTIKKVIGY